jgi:hypothetical protein
VTAAFGLARTRALSSACPERFQDETVNFPAAFRHNKPDVSTWAFRVVTFRKGDTMSNVTPQVRVWRSIQELGDQYKAGNKKPLEDLWRAWKQIKELPPDDPNSFFTLGGYHGEPFRGPGETDQQYWGGYCHHNNVLFPTWQRVYLLKLEEALRTVPGREDVTLPYWDETSAASQANGIPWALTQQTVELDGETIQNPLRSFAFTADIVDRVSGDKSVCTKPTGYETVRYPLTGLVGLLLANIGLVVARFSQSFPGSLAVQSGTPPVREFIAELWHWRELFDSVGTAKPRARPSCAALIARRTSHG